MQMKEMIEMACQAVLQGADNIEIEDSFYNVKASEGLNPNTVVIKLTHKQHHAYK